MNGSSPTIGQAVTDLLRAGEELVVTPASGATALIVQRKGGMVVATTGIAVATRFGAFASDMHISVTLLSGMSVSFASTVRTTPLAGVATTTNDNAVAGEIGEFATTTVAVGGAVAVSTGVPVDVCTLALTAGDWDVSAVLDRALTGTTATQHAAGIALSANTIEPQAGNGGLGSDASVVETCTFGTAITGSYSTPIPAVRVKLAVATTLHLVAASTFSAGTVGAFGTIRARRVR